MNDVKRPDSLEKSWRGKIRLQNRSQIRGVQRSVLGTKRSSRAGLMMSVDWDRAEVTFQGRGDRFYPARKSAFTQPLKVAP